MTKWEYINYWKFAPISTKKLIELENQEGLKRMFKSKSIWIYEDNHSKHMKIIKWSRVLTIVIIFVGLEGIRFTDVIDNFWINLFLIRMPLYIAIYFLLTIVLHYLLCIIFLKESDVEKA